MAVPKPLHYRARVTTKKTICVLVILWVTWIGFIIMRYSGIDENDHQSITSNIAGIMVVYLLATQIE